jgi:hypothetical protein
MKIHDAERSRVPFTSTGSPRTNPAHRSLRDNFDGIVGASSTGFRRRFTMVDQGAVLDW